MVEGACVVRPRLSPANPGVSERNTSSSMYHPVGTARIGRDEGNSVVDTDCRVHGIDGLRVIDASIFPEQISGHPSAVLIGIGEKYVGQTIVNGYNADADVISFFLQDVRKHHP